MMRSILVLAAALAVCTVATAQLVTINQFKCMFPRVPDEKANSFMGPLNDVLARYEINNLNRIAMFLAQTGMETDYYATFVEYTNPDGTNPYCPNYSGGCRYKGRGAIQLTHDYNYRRAGEELGQPFLQNPDMVAELPWAFEVSGLFWKWTGLNAPSDAKNLEQVTRLINGGLNGYEARRQQYETAFRCIQNPPPPPPPQSCRVTYTVKSGDSLWSISQQFGTTIDAIARASNIDPSKMLYPGDVLCIP